MSPQGAAVPPSSAGQSFSPLVIPFASSIPLPVRVVIRIFHEKKAEVMMRTNGKTGILQIKTAFIPAVFPDLGIEQLHTHTHTLTQTHTLTNMDVWMLFLLQPSVREVRGGKT